MGGKWENRRFSRASRSAAASRKNRLWKVTFHRRSFMFEQRYRNVIVMTGNSNACIGSFGWSVLGPKRNGTPLYYGQFPMYVPTGLEKPMLAEQIAGGNWHLLKSTYFIREWVKECLKIEAIVCGYYGKSGKVRKVMHKTHHEWHTNYTIYTSIWGASLLTHVLF